MYYTILQNPLSRIIMSLYATKAAKLQIYPSKDQQTLLSLTYAAYKNGCNFISEKIFLTGILSKKELHRLYYKDLRKNFYLKSQMACSVIATVVAKYKTNKSNGHKFTKVIFKNDEYDLVFNRDYSLSKNKSNVFSVNNISGKRLSISFNQTNMEKYFTGAYKFGTAKLIYKKINKTEKWYLHIPMTNLCPQIETQYKKIDNVAASDLGLNKLLATYMSKNDKTDFVDGGFIKHKRTLFANQRKGLQICGTKSARRKLKIIGSRESRWMTDVNHCVSKALVTNIKNVSPNSLLVLEDLSGIRQSTEKVRINDRYISVSWSFYQLRTMIEYKAYADGIKVLLVNPEYTSQHCPKCGCIDKKNRNKKTHIFKCISCHFQSNDDRVAAMNLCSLGLSYLAEQYLMEHDSIGLVDVNLPNSTKLLVEGVGTPNGRNAIGYKSGRLGFIKPVVRTTGYLQAPSL